MSLLKNIADNSLTTSILPHVNWPSIVWVSRGVVACRRVICYATACLHSHSQRKLVSYYNSIHSKSMNTPFCNRRSGTGFSGKKTSLARQISHQVAPFCQDAVLSF